MHSETPPFLDVENLTVAYEDGSVLAVEGVSITANEGDFVSLLGPTGSGKSTILNTIAGFLKPRSGTIRIDGASVNGPGPERGIVFQDFVLFPWKSVLGNVEFGLKLKGVKTAERQVQAMNMLKLVGLDHRAGAYPYQLSGGMRQRVAIARCFVNRPKILLMDEPFGSLDAQTRFLMQQLILELCQQFRTTVIFVTHDVDEAIFLGDRLYVLTAPPGRIKEHRRIELGRPRLLETTVSDSFIQTKREILASIKSEVNKAVNGSNAKSAGGHVES